MYSAKCLLWAKHFCLSGCIGKNAYLFKTQNLISGQIVLTWLSRKCSLLLLGSCGDSSLRLAELPKKETGDG
jgi:hypothetical protein